MSHYFPDYRGDDRDYDAACAFLLDKFVRLNQNMDKSIYAVSVYLAEVGSGCSTDEVSMTYTALYLCDRYQGVILRFERCERCDHSGQLARL
jgi:hypothetical protein